MIKRGFTLAEVLISLAIIGVIASLTLPTLQVNIQKQQVGPALAKAINTLESANRLALEEGNARSLAELRENDDDNYFDVLSKYMNLTEATRTKKYFLPSGTSSTILNNANYTEARTTNDGITYFLFMPNSALARTGTKMANPPANSNPKYAYRYYTVYVDINGINKGPNTKTKDVFMFWVDTKGAVIPYGGTEYAEYTGSNTVLWKNSCGKKGNSGDSCTGSVVDNGFKVTYY